MAQATIRNSELYKSFKALSEVTCRILQESEIPAPVRARNRTRFTGLGYWTSPENVTVNVWYINDHKPTILETEETYQCLDVMRNCQEVQRHFDCRVGLFTRVLHLTAENHLIRFLINLLDELGEPIFSMSGFDKTYTEMEDFWYNDWLPYEILIPLENTSIEMQPIDLGDGWSIRHIQIDEMERLINTHRIPIDILKRFQPVLFWNMKVEKKFLLPDEKIDRLKEYTSVDSEIRDVISAMRLFKPGYVSFQLYVIRGGFWQFNQISWTHDNTRYSTKNPYIITEEESASFKDFIPRFRTLTKDPSLEVALRRLDYAIERDRSEDIIIDTLVAFEALFLNREGEISYRLSLRVSACVQEPGTDRYNVYAKMRTAYDLRNKVIHGAPSDSIDDFLSKKNLELKTFTEEIVENLRKSMKAYMEKLELGMNKNEFIDQLDQLITGKPP